LTEGKTVYKLMNDFKIGRVLKSEEKDQLIKYLIEQNDILENALYDAYEPIDYNDIY
jgi:hypothetical protein